MPNPNTNTDQVEHLLRNAELRDQLEPLLDESIVSVDATRMTTRNENEFLESMLEWERAPMLPIRDWFSPPLEIAQPETVPDHRMAATLAETVERLFQQHIVLDFTDHLSDRQLYTLVYRDILPAYEKKIDRRDTYLHWDCANTSDDPQTWLRFYATEEEREVWADETGCDPPPAETLPFRRRLPQAPM
ncbi:MAG: hypothetical protein AAGG46_03965 [Planctomycetota bacterium]